MPPGLKAGLIGAGVAVLLSLLSLVPCLGCITAGLTLVIYVGVGALAAHWTEAPRDVGKGAGTGAVAGLITASAGGLTLMVVNALRFTAGGAEATLRRQFRQFPPGMRNPWGDLGFVPGRLAHPAFAIGGSALCCGLGILLAAALGAAGGAILVSKRRGAASSITSPENGE